LKTLKKIALVLNILAAALLVTSYFAVYISPEKTVAVALLPFVYVSFLITNAVFVLFWLFINWKYSLISAVSMIIGIRFFGLIFPVLSFFSGENKPGEIKIMTYNVMVFGLYDWEGNKNIKSGILKQIGEENPSIVCLQEAYWNGTNRNFVTIDSVKKVIGADFEFRAAMATAAGGQNFGLATVSKYPIVNTYSQKFEDSFNGFIYTDILIDDDTVRVYNCHLQSIQLEQNDYTLIEEFAEGDENTKMKTVLKKYLKSLTRRAEQAEVVRASIDSCNYPVFVCGDFNDGPLTYTYFKIAKGLRDSYSSKGKYPGYTWDNFKIKQRIDYILYCDKFSCTSHKVIQSELSDHYAVVAEFDWDE
jgi:endonuclease/exonuclease/phosphatase family metal-dependent hydrolase